MKLGDLKVGILGGGQLGQMLLAAANDFAINISILDPAERASSYPFCANYTQGDFEDFDAVYNFGQGLDVITIEIEKVNTEALRKLQAQGVRVVPSPDVIEIIQDKGAQKQFLKENNIPTSDFSLLDEVLISDLTLPCVQKIRRGGYDGQGVRILRKETDLPLKGESVIEDLVPIQQEFAVIVARNSKQETATYDLVEMQMDPELHLVDYLSAPANCSSEIETKGRKLAVQVAEAINLEGIMAIELFLTEDDNLLVNELSPRPHNSGHHTIEATYTSQFAQLLRCLMQLPLGSTKLRSAAVMQNILGTDGYKGVPDYQGLEVCQDEGVYIHLYGKSETRPGRKMGHVTVLDSSVDKAIKRADIIKEKIKVKA